MADSTDKKLQLVIEILTREVGEKRAKEILEEASTGTAELGQETEKTTEQFKSFGGEARGIHSALFLIAREAGPAMGAALAGAMALATGGILSAVFAVRELFNWIGELQKKAEEFRERQASLWLAAQQGAEDAAGAAQGFADKLEDVNTKSDRLKTTFENQNKLLNAQIDAHKKLLDAIEKEALAAVAGDKEKEAAVRKRFDSMKGEYDLKAERQKIDLEQQQLAQLQLAKVVDSAAAKGLEKIKENLTAQKPQLQAAVDDLTKQFGSPEKMKATFDQATALLQKGLASGAMKELPGGGLEISDRSKFPEKDAMELFRFGGVGGIRTAQENWARFQAAQGEVTANANALKEIDRGLGTVEGARETDTDQMSTLTASINELIAELKIHTELAARTQAIGMIGDVVGVDTDLAAGKPLQQTQVDTVVALKILLDQAHENSKAILQLILDGAKKHETLAQIVAQVSSQMGQSGVNAWPGGF